MKKIVYVDHEQLGRIRQGALDDEINGLDPGAYWARMYPEATEIEFVVESPERRSGDEGR